MENPYIQETYVTDEDLYGVKPPIQNAPVEDNLMAYNEHYNMFPEEEKPKFLNFLQNAGVNTRDFLMNNVARYGGAMGGAQLGSMFGPIGALAGMIGGGIFGNRFTNQPYIGGVTTVDEFGNLISGEELDRLNALGGYYTDAARASRRRDKSIAAYRARDAEVKGRYEQLLEQQAAEETARQAEADRLAAANRATRGTSEATGGYQSSFASDDDFMSGSGTAAEMGSFKQGGIVGIL